LATTSWTPSISNTARIGPPAMIPVPATAVRITTRPAPWRPSMSWCRVRPSRSGTRTRLRFACSVALRIASGTSLALPLPKPTRPRWSPTTTSAAKPKRLPPFTVFDTRLIATRRSANSGVSSRSRRSSRRSRPSRRCSRSAIRHSLHDGAGPRTVSADPGAPDQVRGPDHRGGAPVTGRHPHSSELQPAFAGRVVMRLDLAVEEEAAAVEVARLDPGLPGALGDRRADLLGRLVVVLADDPQILFEAGGRGERHDLHVVDQLHADVPRRTVDREARPPVGHLATLVPYAQVALEGQIPFAVCHLCRPYIFLPDLRKMNSPLYRMRLPL